MLNTDPAYLTEAIGLAEKARQPALTNTTVRRYVGNRSNSRTRNRPENMLYDVWPARPLRGYNCLMSLKHMDMDFVLRRLADRRVEEAMQEGKFDNLKGAGEPVDLEPMPTEENARLTWWALRILRRNDFTPEEIRWRKALDHLRARLAAAETEPHIRQLVSQINQMVHRINTLGTNALNTPVTPVVLEHELQRISTEEGKAK